jgi:hypothetical protein
MSDKIKILFMAETTEIPPSPCPTCGEQIDLASCEEAALPNPGDPGVCLYCGELLTYNDDLTLRKSTLRDIAGYRQQVGLLDQITDLQQLIRSYSGKMAVDLRPSRKPQ